jgi:predicted transcriptional regulator
MKKEQVIETVSELPQEFELDVLLEKLVFIEKVEKGLKQIKEGKTRTHEEVKEIVKGW